MISAILILNQRGEVLIARSFREDVLIRSAGEAFRSQIIGARLVDRCPVKSVGSLNFLHIAKNNLYLVAVTRLNANTALVFRMLYSMVDLFQAYFEVLTEASVRENFVLIYELLDEIVDYGYPQISDAEVLKMYITQEGVRSDLKASESSKITVQATGAITWRRDNIKYRKNEVFLDAIEEVNALVSSQGNVLNAHVNGRIVMKAFLSGMPDCKIGLNDKMVLDKTVAGRRPTRPGEASSGIEIEDVTFHQCVRLGKFDTDRTISFVPPDGEFELMKYRITDNILLPFKIMPPIVRELGRTRLEIQLSVKSVFSANLFSNNVIIKIPCPQNTAEAKTRVSGGRAKYDPVQGGIIWKIRRFPGHMEYRFSGTVSLVASTSGKDSWSRPPISMSFQVPMFTASGLRVRFLRVIEKSDYETTKWVRYVTKGGSYQNRI